MPIPSVFPKFLKAVVGGASVVPPTDGVLPEVGRFAGDLEPALIYSFLDGKDYGLANASSAGSGIPSVFPIFLKAQGLTTADYLFFFNLSTALGVSVVTDGTATVTNDKDGVPVFRYTWVTALAASGMHDGQFRAESKSDNKRIYTDKFRFPVRPQV